MRSCFWTTAKLITVREYVAAAHPGVLPMSDPGAVAVHGRYAGLRLPDRPQPHGQGLLVRCAAMVEATWLPDAR